MNLRGAAVPLLALLSTTAGARADAMNGLRSCVARVGDVDGDGVPDLAVASRDRGRDERVWIVSGKDGARILEIPGRASGDRFGSQIVGAGDWDRDGVPDLIVAAEPRRPTASESGYRRIVSGRAGDALVEIEDGGPIGGTADLDGDGRLDLLLTTDSDTGSTEIAVVSGRDRARPVRIPGHERRGSGRGHVVEALAWIDDVDGDGWRDVAASRSRRVKRADDEREVVAFSSRTGKALWTTATEEGAVERGHALTSLSDLTGDGVAEILAVVEDRDARALDGATGAIVWSRTLRAHVMYSLGSSLDRVGDVDRDGVEDWIVGANESFFFDGGLCEIRSGRTGSTLHALREDRAFGFDGCGVGDVDGDGVPDFAVGAERQDGWTADDSAEPAVQVRSGKDASILWMRRHVDLRR